MQLEKVETTNNNKYQSQYVAQHINYPAYKKCEHPADFLNAIHVGKEDFCRWIFTPSTKKGKKWCFIGDASKSYTPESKTKRYKSTLVNENIKVLSNNVFYSPSEFFYWRCTKQLAKLTANWIDIDTVEHEKLSDKDAKSLFKKVISALERSKIPPPTGYVLTGFGGIHFYWIYDEKVDRYKNVAMWKSVSKAIIDRLSTKLGKHICTIDSSCSTDPARVLRLPGSVRMLREPALPGKMPKKKKNELNNDFEKRLSNYDRQVKEYPAKLAEYQYITSNKRCKLGSVDGVKYRSVYSYLGGPTYSFDQLISLLDVPLYEDRYKDIDLVNETPKKSKNNKSRKKVTGKHTIGEWWFKNYTHIIMHARKNGVKQGQRDLYAFIIFVCLQHMHKNKSKEVAFEAIKKINSEIIGLQESELERYLQTAIHGKSGNRKGPIYRYNKKGMATFLKQLGIDTSYLFENDKVTLTDDEVRERKSSGAKITNEAQKKNSLDQIRKAFYALKDQGKKTTKAAVSKLSGKSLSTVHRAWNEVII